MTLRLFTVTSNQYALDSFSLCDLTSEQANILFDENGIPKLADFGLFRIIDKNATHPMSRHNGRTTLYASPELESMVATDNLRITTAIDIYAFGSVIYEVCQGYDLVIWRNVVKISSRYLQVFSQRQRYWNANLQLNMGK